MLKILSFIPGDTIFIQQLPRWTFFTGLEATWALWCLLGISADILDTSASFEASFLDETVKTEGTEEDREFFHFQKNPMSTSQSKSRQIDENF